MSSGRVDLHPVTGLAADYLEQFNQAIMLLELLATTPDCVEDFYAWRPVSYREHLQATPIEHRARALAAYEAIDPALRQRFDTLAEDMADVLEATRDAMLSAGPSPAIGLVANRAALWLGVLAARASAVIEGAAP